MITEIFIPKIGSVAENITFVEWKKANGTLVQKDDVVAVVDTEKVSSDIEAPASGLLFYLCEVQDRLQAGDVIGIIANSVEEFTKYRTESVPTAPGRDDSEPSVAEESSRAERPSSYDQRNEVTPVHSISFPDDRRVRKRLPFRSTRRRGAERLVASLRDTAQVTVVTEVDVTNLDDFRQEWLKIHPNHHITFVDVFVKLVAVSLREFPILNASLVDEEVVCWGDYNIGVAVALNDGLIVPVVRYADTKSLLEISREIGDLANRAKLGQLDPNECRGGTFTLTSSGRFDVEIFTPIINPPESAILGLGKIRARPTVFEGNLAIRTMAYLCLTHDHRIVDGQPADGFLTKLKDTIEHPGVFRMILA